MQLLEIQFGLGLTAGFLVGLLVFEYREWRSRKKQKKQLRNFLLDELRKSLQTLKILLNGLKPDQPGIHYDRTASYYYDLPLDILKVSFDRIVDLFESDSSLSILKAYKSIERFNANIPPGKGQEDFRYLRADYAQKTVQDIQEAITALKA